MYVYIMYSICNAVCSVCCGVGSTVRQFAMAKRTRIENLFYNFVYQL